MGIARNMELLNLSTNFGACHQASIEISIPQGAAKMLT
jgi:hypothetical protein